MNKESRGIRNNNPFNIIKSNNNWVGKVENNEDERFEQFKKDVYGIRAGIKLIKNYHKNGYNTTEKIIGRFAPPFENNTKEYIAYVSKKLGVSPKEKLVLSDNLLLIFAQAIITMENGYNPYSEELILKAIELAA